MFEDFFDFDNLKSIDDKPEAPKLSADEYVARTKRIFHEMQWAYGEAYYNRSLKEAELPADAVCNACTGCGTFGDGKECFKDWEGGECYERCFDHEHFTDSIQTLMFEQPDFFILSEAELLNQGEGPRGSVATEDEQRSEP